MRSRQSPMNHFMVLREKNMIKIRTERLWRAKGSIEGIVTVSFLGASVIAAAVGFISNSGIIFSRDGRSSTRIIKRVEEYVDK